MQQPPPVNIEPVNIKSDTLKAPPQQPVNIEPDTLKAPPQQPVNIKPDTWNEKEDEDEGVDEGVDEGEEGVDEEGNEDGEEGDDIPQVVPPTIVSYSLTVPENKPFYYYAQLEQFKRDNILPQIDLQITHKTTGGGTDVFESEVFGGDGEEANVYTPGLYGFFERSINRFTSTQGQGQGQGQEGQGTRGVYNTFATLADRVLGKPANGNQVIDLRNGVMDDIETESELSELEGDGRLESLSSSDSEDEVLAPALVPAASSEEDEKARDFIQTKLRGTKLFYFMQRNKEMWI